MNKRKSVFVVGAVFGCIASVRLVTGINCIRCICIVVSRAWFAEMDVVLIVGSGGIVACGGIESRQAGARGLAQYRVGDFVAQFIAVYGSTDPKRNLSAT